MALQLYNNQALIGLTYTYQIKITLPDKVSDEDKAEISNVETDLIEFIKLRIDDGLTIEQVIETYFRQILNDSTDVTINENDEITINLGVVRPKIITSTDSYIDYDIETGGLTFNPELVVSAIPVPDNNTISLNDGGEYQVVTSEVFNRIKDDLKAYIDVFEVDGVTILLNENNVIEVNLQAIFDGIQNRIIAEIPYVNSVGEYLVLSDRNIDLNIGEVLDYIKPLVLTEVNGIADTDDYILYDEHNNRLSLYIEKIRDEQKTVENTDRFLNYNVERKCLSFLPAELPDNNSILWRNDQLVINWEKFVALVDEKLTLADITGGNTATPPPYNFSETYYIPLIDNVIHLEHYVAGEIIGLSIQDVDGNHTPPKTGVKVELQENQYQLVGKRIELIDVPLDFVFMGDTNNLWARVTYIPAMVCETSSALNE
jgi:hypothetical protein